MGDGAATCNMGCGSWQLPRQRGGAWEGERSATTLRAESRSRCCCGLSAGGKGGGAGADSCRDGREGRADDPAEEGNSSGSRLYGAQREVASAGGAAKREGAAIAGGGNWWKDEPEWR
jgi:hypothetical protein